MSTPNMVSLRLPLELVLLIQEDCGKDFLSATIILRILTEHYKDRLSKEEYEDLKDRYSRTAKEAKHLKDLREREKTILRKSKEVQKANDRLRVVNQMLEHIQEGMPAHLRLTNEKERLLEQLKEP